MIFETLVGAGIIAALPIWASMALFAYFIITLIIGYMVQK